MTVKGWERLTREEIVTRACQAVAAVAHEKSRNAELAYRLQQTHEDSIEAKQLKGRFAELQVSHGCCKLISRQMLFPCNVWS